jgi:endonuclease G
MSRNEDLVEKLRRVNLEIRGQDPKLDEESRDALRPTEEALPLKAATAVDPTEMVINQESIILKRLRPVLAVKNNTTELVFSDADDSQVWKERLSHAKSNLDRAIPATGRIELTGGRLDWVGTGWLVADEVIVTNRHVANEFALRKGEAFDFRMGLLGRVGAHTDFLQEIDNPATLRFRLVRPLHIEEETGPDVSFFEVEPTSGKHYLAAPVPLARAVKVTQNVAVIGYPAYDSRIPDRVLMDKLYGGLYDRKRLAPGAITKLDGTRLLHNCTTLGGNSGSLVVDLDSGEALGLHFSGSFLATNYAVRAEILAELLADVRSGRTRRGRPSLQRPAERPPARPQGPVSSVQSAVRASVEVTIPLTISLSIGDPAAVPAVRRRWPVVPKQDPDMSEIGIEGEEARPDDYRDRKGYAAKFLREECEVELPAFVRDARDVLDYDNGGMRDTVLRYEHFSVVMSRSRRMCFFSAVNIDGRQSRKSPRAGWKWDPRIPRSQQIMNECYGNPPRFSRGHMTRREDPGWGDSEVARRGNEDSMHVTNTAPQMQAFNAPIWLGLEDYALQHARDDEMMISVFTGPYFSRLDPILYGVRIPLKFWKIIAFIHDETGELCATGYEMSQESTLQPEEEFVFGPFDSPQLGFATQVPISGIEARSGLTFGRLASLDPFSSDNESVDGDRVIPLLALEQIRFFR